MIAIKILFTICLLVPLALFMRFLLKQISAEKPKQSYTKAEIDDYNNRKRKKKKSENRRRESNASAEIKATDSENRKQQKNAEKSGEKVRTQSSPSRSVSSRPNPSRSASSRPDPSRSASSRPDPSRPASSRPGKAYTQRKPAEWHRSERVPFGEDERLKIRRESHKEDPDHDRINAPHTAEETDNVIKAEGASKNRKNRNPRKRSDKSPSKRQLRKNRERARKRDLKKRKKERKAEGK